MHQTENMGRPAEGFKNRPFTPLCIVRVQVFDRKGVHLYTKLTITLAEALLGFKKTIKHLDGHEVVVEREAVSQPGTRVGNIGHCVCEAQVYGDS